MQNQPAPPLSLREAKWQAGRDLCRARAVCASKALLGSVSPSHSARQAYAKYFDQFSLVDPDSNLSCLKRSAKSERLVRNSMYSPNLPHKDPAFFSFSSHHDVNRLASVMDVEIVIYLTDSLERLSGVEIFHDFRCFGGGRPPVYFLFTLKKELFKMPAPLDELFEPKGPMFFTLQDSDYVRVSKKDSAQFTEDDEGFASDRFLEAAASVAGLEAPPREEPFVGTLEHVVHAGMTPSSSLSARLHDLWKQKVVVVGYCRALKLPTGSRRFSNLRGSSSPESHYFSTLFVAAPEGCNSMSDLSLSGADQVLCYYADGYLAPLSRQYADSVIARLYRTDNPDKPSANEYVKFPLPGRLEIDEARRGRRLESKAAKRAKKKVCACEVCSSEEFNDNMNWSGPETLSTNPLDVRELLALLGLDTKQNLDAVEEMCSLSVAAFDIESMTVSLDVSRPVEPAQLPYASIDKAHLEAHLKKVQKPIMISHVDALTFELSAAERLTLRASSDDESAIFRMMQEYWNGVLQCQANCRRRKLELSRPILDIVSEYKRAFFDEAHKWTAELSPFDPDTGIFDTDLAAEVKHLQDTHPPGVIAKAWKQTLPGQLETRLRQLAVSYTVFSFYG